MDNKNINGNAQNKMYYKDIGNKSDNEIDKNDNDISDNKLSNDKTNTKRGKIFVISAPSGAGKSTLCNKVLEKFPEIAYSISHTTRAPRGGEQNGVEYFFISVEEFKKRIQDNLWAEWAEVHGNFYGTSLKFIEDNISQGGHILLDIDVQGAKQFTKAFPEAVTIFIMPPSIDILKQRLQKRGTDSDDVIAKRLVNAEYEINQSSFYKHIILNDDLKKAEQEIKEIFSRYII